MRNWGWFVFLGGWVLAICIDTARHLIWGG